MQCTGCLLQSMPFFASTGTPAAACMWWGERGRVRGKRVRDQKRRRDEGIERERERERKREREREMRLSLDLEALGHTSPAWLAPYNTQRRNEEAQQRGTARGGGREEGRGASPSTATGSTWYPWTSPTAPGLTSAAVAATAMARAREAMREARMEGEEGERGEERGKRG